LVAFTQSLAGELSAAGVKVQVCLPGMVHTEFHTVLTPDDVVTASLSGLAPLHGNFLVLA
jgi:short-subunit dehydrogenase